MSDLTASDLVDMLRRHYLPTHVPAGRDLPGVLAAEIQAPGGLRRADAIWAPMTLTGGVGLIGHEIKVSRGDLLIELADPSKADPWLRHCVAWWLVVADPALVDGLDTPDAWGVMAPPSGRRTRTMTVLRAAPALKPGDTSEAWRRVMAWEHFRAVHEIADLRRQLENATRCADDWRAAAENLRRTGGSDDPDLQAAGRVLEAIRHRMRGSREKDEPRVWSIDEQMVADAVVDLQRTRLVADDAVRELGYLIGAVEQASAPLSRVRRQLTWIRDHRGEHPERATA